jgi:hypothetical protein
MLTLIDENTRECLAIDVARILKSKDVLERLSVRFGYASANEAGWCWNRLNTNLRTGSTSGGRSSYGELWGVALIRVQLCVFKPGIQFGSTCITRMHAVRSEMPCLASIVDLEAVRSLNAPNANNFTKAME